MSTSVVTSLLETTKDFSIEETLAFLASEYPNQVVFSTSFGQEDQVITDLIGQNQLPITVFTFTPLNQPDRAKWSCLSII